MKAMIFTLGAAAAVSMTSAMADNSLYLQRALVKDPLGVYDIATDQSGDILVADGTQSVVRFDSTGVLRPFPVPITGLSSPRALTVDKHGNIYVSTDYETLRFGPDGTALPFATWIKPSEGSVAVTSKDEVLLADGSDVLRFASNGSPSPFATPIENLQQCYAVTVDESDNIYVATRATTGSSTILKFNAAGDPLQLPHPIAEENSIDVAVDNQGNIYTVDWPDGYNPRVNKYDASGTQLSFDQTALDVPLKIRIDTQNHLLATDKREVVPLDANGAEIALPHPIVSLLWPYGVALDSQSNLYVSDYGGRILKYGPDGNSLPLSHRIRGLIAPSGMAIDSQGNIYVALYGYLDYTGQTGPNAIYRYDPSGQPLPFAHPIENLDGPIALAFDSHGNILVAQIDGNEVLRFDPSGHPLPFAQRVLAVSGFWDIAIDAGDNLYVTEGAYIEPPMRVRKFSSSGVQVNFPSPIDGLHEPVGIAVDAAGSIWVSSWGATEDPPQNVYFRQFAVDGSSVPITVANLHTGSWGTIAIGPGHVMYMPNFNGSIDEMLPDEIFSGRFE